MHLTAVLQATSALTAPARLQALVSAKCDRLPLPGSGQTLGRWQALAEVASHDLSLAKLYEGHTDALAILAELLPDDAPERSPQGIWGTWAAEAPGCRVTVTEDGVLHGTKAWCSGASHVTHAVMTAWRDGGSNSPQLVAVDLRQPGVRVAPSHWHAVGMAATDTAQVHFDAAAARLVGSPGSYLCRPGFWQGGAGVAACWWGGTLAIAQALHRAARAMPADAPAAPFRWSALGRVDIAVSASAALLREAAAWIDANPQADASTQALRTRQSAEQAARQVLDLAGRALGPTPYCTDAAFARMAADLPVFIRQSHAERDDASLGHCLGQQERPWAL